MTIRSRRPPPSPASWVQLQYHSALAHEAAGDSLGLKILMASFPAIYTDQILPTSVMDLSNLDLRLGLDFSAKVHSLFGARVTSLNPDDESSFWLLTSGFLHSISFEVNRG